MHSFLRAVGFGGLTERKMTEDLINEVCTSCDVRNAVKLNNGRAFVEYRKEFAPNCGLIVCGEMDGDGFHRDYYLPYFKTDTVGSYGDLIIEKHGEKDSFAGVCEDDRLGSTLIFYLQNAAQYRKACQKNAMLGVKVGTSFMALSTEGKILLPIAKIPEQELMDREAASKRKTMLAAARNGDQEAIESLTLEDMDAYTMISRRIQTEDVFTIVDTFFMPYGMECDHYQIMGEIQSWKLVKNTRSKEKIYQMQLLCNDILMDVCINETDLMGDPDVGRRFKGSVWLQGHINFQEEE